MISKAKSKFIKSLQIKKYRKQEQCFVVEGEKSIIELLQSDFEVVMLVATEAFLNQYAPHNHAGFEVIQATESDLKTLGEFQSNDRAVAVARIKPDETVPIIGERDYVLALDDIRDPGNLGTIIRTADWYGIQIIIASPGTADFYNTKVISATMGSFTRVKVRYHDLTSFISGFHGPVYGTFLNGENVHTLEFERSGMILIGNEARGISPEVERLVTRRITIPRFGRAESLNAGIAASVVLDNLRRRLG